MPEEMYRVVFSGDISGEKNQDQIILDFATLMKIDIMRAQRFFDGRRMVVKSNISREQAKDYVDALQQIGAIAVSELIPKSVGKPEKSFHSVPPAPPEQPKHFVISDLGGRVSIGAIIAIGILVAGFVYLSLTGYDLGNLLY